KKSLYYERINLATRETKQFLYVTEEVSEFYIKGTASFTDVKEFEITRPKKFSEYFNRRDMSVIGTRGLIEGREILRFLDYVNVTKTLVSMFPKEGSIGLEVPKPSSTASIISTFATGEFTWALSGALSSLFMVSDVIATQEVNKIMNDVRGYNTELLEQAKLQGLEKLQLFMDTTRTNELIGFRLIGDVPEETHFKVMRGEINTFIELENSIERESSDKYYSYLIKIIDDKSTERKTYIIDAVYDQ
uniref:hypothetical protein n=1 Tax=Aquimarina sp. I32.4 TaxID=2053903 RepID=UPI001304CFCC